MAFELDSCCGFSLRTGTIIIGVIHSIGTFVLTIFAAVYSQNSHEGNKIDAPEITVLTHMPIIVATVFAIQCLFSIVIIFAAVTNRPNLLLPWLVLIPISLFVYIISILIGISQDTNTNRMQFIMVHLFVAIGASVLFISEILVVFKFYRQLKKFNF